MNDRLDTSIFGDAADDVHYQAEPEHQTGPEPGGRGRGRGKRFVVLALVVALVALVGYLGVTKLGQLTGGTVSADYPGPGTGSVTVEVKAGDTGSAIAETLAAAGVVKSAQAYLQAAADNEEAAGIQPGSYIMKKEMRAQDAVAFLADPANRHVTKVTIPEGRRVTEVFALLSKATGIPVADYEAAAKNPDALALPADAKGNLEGYLFPATYEFGPKDTAADQLREMVATMIATTTALGIDETQLHRVLTVAGLVEAEAARDEDRPKVARVIENRLAKGMQLQLDSTVVYVAGRRGISTTPAERLVKSPYNTYYVKGLPAGPISAPGKASIQAALNPAPGPWLFFVTVNPQTGETLFTSTLADHDKFVAQFQQWCAAHKGVC